MFEIAFLPREGVFQITWRGPPRPPTRRPRGKGEQVDLALYDPSVSSVFEQPGGGRIRDKSEPVEVVPLRGFEGRQVKVVPALVAPFKSMELAFRAQGGDGFPLISGYRSVAVQAQLFARAVRKYGSEARARKWVAPPGNSAHHSGRAIDIDLGTRPTAALASEGRQTRRWLWLSQHANNWGFFPYPAEPWHWEFNP